MFYKFQDGWWAGGFVSKQAICQLHGATFFHLCLYFGLVGSESCMQALNFSHHDGFFLEP